MLPCTRCVTSSLTTYDVMLLMWSVVMKVWLLLYCMIVSVLSAAI